MTMGINVRHREGQDRKDRVPARDVDGVWPGEPPEVVALRIAQPSERRLNALPRRGVGLEAGDQRLEGRGAVDRR